MVAPMSLRVCGRAVFFFWWCGFLPVGIWRILLRTVRSRCSSPATSSVGTSRRLCYLFLGVLRLVSRGSVIRFLVLALVLSHETERGGSVFVREVLVGALRYLAGVQI